jgi:hypothetical protein
VACIKDSQPRQNTSASQEQVIGVWPRLVNGDSISASTIETQSTLSELRVVESVQLGASVHEAPVSPTEVIVQSSNIIVLDRVGRSVLEYDRRGRFMRRLGAVNGQRLQQPRRLIARRDTVFVFDITGPNRLSRIAASGLQSDQVSRPQALDAAFADDGRLFLVQTIPDPRTPLQGFIADGSRLNDTSARSFCPPAPLLLAAQKSGTALRLYQDTRVAVLDSVVFCSQPTSGTLQRYSLTGAVIAPFNRVLSFYRPLAQLRAANMRSIQAAVFTGTPVTAVWPYANGMALAYYDYDSSSTSAHVSLVSSCDSTRGPLRCVHARTRDAIVGFSAPDTVWLFRETSDRELGLPRLLTTLIDSKRR